MVVYGRMLSLIFKKIFIVIRHKFKKVMIVGFKIIKWYKKFVEKKDLTDTKK